MTRRTVNVSVEHAAGQLVGMALGLLVMAVARPLAWWLGRH